MKIKICGVTNPSDAEAAVRAGAEYIGLIFVKDSPRYVSLYVGRQIAMLVGKYTKLVGVFCDQELKEIETVVSTVPLEMVQLHGIESPAFCQSISVPVIKTVILDAADEINATNGSGRKMQSEFIRADILWQAQKYSPFCQHLLIDRPKDIRISGWLETAIKAIKDIQDRLGDYFFAGGLNIENVQSVIKSIHPFGLDLASGTEINPRRKDHDLMDSFCASATKQYHTHIKRSNQC